MTARQPIDAVEYVFKVAEAATAEEDGGAFYPHLGKGSKYI
jgi:hypothetical protein